MNIFVTGATGVLGSEVVPLLVTSGHQVRALSRSRHNIEVLSRLGAESVPADLFDLASLKQALVGSEAVLHLATRIPRSRVWAGSRPGGRTIACAGKGRAIW